MSSAQLTPDAIKALAAEWYHLLDVHAPMVDVLPLLSGKPEMVFPEVTLSGLAGFEGWYQRVIRIFFDEVHNVKEVRPVITGDEAMVKVIVEWSASTWTPPEAASKRIHLDADQDWVVRVSPAGSLVITKYVVNVLTYYSGSAKL
jgi:hypothetical protein